VRQGEHNLSDLQQAILLEKNAVERLKHARARLVHAIDRARGDGVPYDHLARAAVRARDGRAATVSARNRETARLRQLHRRQNRRHAILKAGTTGAALNELPSTRKEAAMPRLVKRRVVEETFQHDEPEDDLDGAEDDLGDEEDKDEPEVVEPAAPKRRARR
jgi:hypothetical protein